MHKRGLKAVVRVAMLVFLSCGSASAHYVFLSWGHVPGVGITYNIYRALGTPSGGSVSCPVVPALPLGSGTPWVKEASGITILSYEDKAVNIGSDYCYFATAELDGLESLPSNVASVEMKPSTPLSFKAAEV